VNFNWLAPHYRWMESVLAGGLLQRCRLAWLDEVCACSRVLLVGEGPGRFLECAVERVPEARFVCVDSSPAMLARAADAVGGCSRVEFVHAMLPDWRAAADGTFDLVVTPFFLDCFSEETLEQVVAVLGGAATDDARWLLTDFQVPEGGFGRWRARVLLWMAYRFFRVATGISARSLVPPDAALGRQGFERMRWRTASLGLIRCELWSRKSPAGV
jgi:SAM-dependent methyltransferase